ncbi:allophanate hydrolase, partial [Staphylococcus epidermidis]
MKIYSQGDQAIIIDIEQEVAEDVTKNLVAVRTHLLNK